LEPSGNPSGTRVAADEAGQAVPRLDRAAGPLAVRFLIGSITRTKVRDAPEAWRREEGESGEPSRSAGQDVTGQDVTGQEVRRAVAKPELQEDEDRRGFDPRRFQEWGVGT
jgi:hypothetical protein